MYKQKRILKVSRTTLTRLSESAFVTVRGGVEGDPSNGCNTERCGSLTVNCMGGTELFEVCVQV